MEKPRRLEPLAEGDVKLSHLCRFVNDEKKEQVGFIFSYIPDSVYVKCALEALAKCVLHRRLLSAIGFGVVEPVSVGGPGGVFQDE